ncbi:MAG: DUF5615 family PIN-like protein [Phycisphaerae bacterium]
MARQPKLYFDEDMSAIMAARLRKLGWDVLTTHQAGRRSTGDEDQLRFATAQGRVPVTDDHSHFIRLHEEFLEKGLPHAGIIVCYWRPSENVVLAELLSLLESVLPETSPNSLLFA